MARKPEYRNPRTFSITVEAEIKDEIDKFRGRLSYGKVITILWQAHKHQVKGTLENENLKLELKEKNKIIEELTKLLEKERLEKEKWRNKYLELKLGSKSVVRDALKFKAIAEKIEEGKSWKEVCASLGFRNVDKIRELLANAFNLSPNERNELPEILRPKDIAEEFKGWVLFRPSKKADPVDYVFVKEENIEMAKQQFRQDASKPIVDPSAKILGWLRSWHDRYLNLMFLGKEGQALDYLWKVVRNNGLRVLIEEYGYERVEEVVCSEERFVDVFLPLLESLKKKKAVEVKADV